MTKKRKILIAAFAAVALSAAAVFAFWGQISNAYHQITKTPNKNGYYTSGQYTAAVLGEVSEKAVDKFANKIISLNADYLTANNRAFFALIPDKSYYLRDKGYEKASYEQIQRSVKEKLTQFRQIELFDALELEDYYKTDGHWRQESLHKILPLFESAMQLTSTNISYEQQKHESFSGAYTKNIMGKIPQESLIYLTNDITNSATVENYQNPKFDKVYDTEKLKGEMAYDVFLSGATPYTKITSPLASTNKELVIFRDSFGSSLAPLFLAEYKTITLVDLRYMASPLLKEMIEFDNQDVLFLYSTSVVANSSILR